MHGTAQPDGRPLGGSELRSYFLLLARYVPEMYVYIEDRRPTDDRPTSHFPSVDFLVLNILVAKLPAHSTKTGTKSANSTFMNDN